MCLPYQAGSSPSERRTAPSWLTSASAACARKYVRHILPDIAIGEYVIVHVGSPFSDLTSSPPSINRAVPRTRHPRRGVRRRFAPSSRAERTTTAAPGGTAQAPKRDINDEINPMNSAIRTWLPDCSTTSTGDHPSLGDDGSVATDNIRSSATASTSYRPTVEMIHGPMP